MHDWLIGGGAELVVLELHKMFPDAPIYTSYSTDEWRKKLNGKVITSYLQSWPFSKLRKFIPFLRGWWFSRLDLSEYDLVISSSGAEAKFIQTTRQRSWVSRLFASQGASEERKGNVHTGTLTAHRSSQHSEADENTSGVAGSAGQQADVTRKTMHIAYIHAPTHYYWSRYNEYMHHPGFGFFDPLARLGLKILVGPMRRWDYRAAQRPDILIANSSYTKAEIKKYYKRNSTVIYPPVDTGYFGKRQMVSGKLQNRTGFVITGRQTPYKRFDLAVVACNKLKLPLVVAGSGPKHKSLKAIAGPTIQFVGQVSRGELRDYLQKAEAFIFPGKDDFGIAAVEALAAGTPVIAYGQGGAKDYVNSKTGLTFEKQTVDSLVKALKNFKRKKFNRAVVKKEAAKFSEQNFQKQLSNLLKSSGLLG